MPAPRPGWVLIRVRASGLNRFEPFTRRGHLPNARFPRILEGAAEARESHRVAFYLDGLATARSAPVQAIAQIIASGLAVMGVEPVEEMR